MAEVVVFRDAEGNTQVGSYGYEDESWDPETGDERTVLSMTRTVIAQGIEPVQWRRPRD